MQNTFLPTSAQLWVSEKVQGNELQEFELHPMVYPSQTAHWHSSHKIYLPPTHHLVDEGALSSVNLHGSVWNVTGSQPK